MHTDPENQEAKCVCWHDHEPFDGLPTHIPLAVSKKDGEFIIQGLGYFCSIACACTYAKERNMLSKNQWKIMRHISRMHGLSSIPYAPSAFMLAKCGGPLSIETFRVMNLNPDSIRIDYMPTRVFVSVERRGDPVFTTFGPKLHALGEQEQSSYVIADFTRNESHEEEEFKSDLIIGSHDIHMTEQSILDEDVQIPTCMQSRDHWKEQEYPQDGSLQSMYGHISHDKTGITRGRKYTPSTRASSNLQR